MALHYMLFYNTLYVSIGTEVSTFIYSSGLAPAHPYELWLVSECTGQEGLVPISAIIASMPNKHITFIRACMVVQKAPSCTHQYPCTWDVVKAYGHHVMSHSDSSSEHRFFL